MEYLRGLVAAVKPRRPGAGAAEEQHERPTKRCRCQASSTSAVGKSQWGQGLVSRYGGEPGSQGRKLRLQYTRQFLDFAVVRAGAPGQWLPSGGIADLVAKRLVPKEDTTPSTGDHAPGGGCIAWP